MDLAGINFREILITCPIYSKILHFLTRTINLHKLVEVLFSSSKALRARYGGKTV